MKAFIILNSPSDFHEWKSIAEYLDPSWEVEYGNHYDNKSFEKACRANAVISSTPYVRQHLQLLDEIRAVNKDALICIHPHEGFKSYTSLDEYISGNLEGGSGSFRTSTEYRLESIDRFYFWGLTHISEWATTLVAQNGLSPDGIRCTGSVYHDYSILPRRSNKETRNILYCSGCMTYGLYGDEDFRISGDIAGGDGDLDLKLLIQHKLRETAIRDRKSIYTSLIIFAELNPRTSITIRLHPGECEKLREYMQRKNKSQGCKEFYYLLKEMERLSNITIEDDGMKLQVANLPKYDCILHHGSTVALQGAFLNIPSLCLTLEATKHYEQTLPDELKTYQTLDVPGRVDISCTELTKEGCISTIINSSAFKAEFLSLIRYSDALLRPWHAYGTRRIRKSPLQAIAEDVQGYFESTNQKSYYAMSNPLSTSKRVAAWWRVLKRIAKSLAYH